MGRYVSYADALARRDEQTASLLVVAIVVWFFTIGALLAACGTSPVGTVTKVDRLPDNTYQLEVINRLDADGDPVTALENAGRSTGCQVGERWPSCD